MDFELGHEREVLCLGIVRVGGLCDDGRVELHAKPVHVVNAFADRNHRRVCLAAVALLTGFMARLASRLTTAMIVGFGLLVWLPALFADSHSFLNWSESVETLGIAATAWIVADFPSKRCPAESAPAILG